MDPATTIQARKAYNEYVIEMQSKGETPIPFEQWKEQNYGGKSSRFRPVEETAVG